MFGPVSPMSKSRRWPSSSARSGCSRCASPGGPTQECSKRSCNQDDPDRAEVGGQRVVNRAERLHRDERHADDGERDRQRVTVFDRGDQHTHRDRECRRQQSSHDDEHPPRDRQSRARRVQRAPRRHSADRRRRFNRGPPRARASSRVHRPAPPDSDTPPSRTGGSGYQPICIVSRQRSRTISSPSTSATDRGAVPQQHEEVRRSRGDGAVRIAVTFGHGGGVGVDLHKPRPIHVARTKREGSWRR